MRGIRNSRPTRIATIVPSRIARRTACVESPVARAVSATDHVSGSRRGCTTPLSRDDHKESVKIGFEVRQELLSRRDGWCVSTSEQPIKVVTIDADSLSHVFRRLVPPRREFPKSLGSNPYLDLLDLRTGIHID